MSKGEPSLTHELLAAKLFVPSIRANLVPRARLLAQLERALATRLTLVAAPAGFGKTTLIAAWLASRSAEHHAAGGGLSEAGRTEQVRGPTQSPRVAWLTLDAEDNKVDRLLHYLLAALRHFAPECGTTTLALLQHTALPPLELLLTPLLNDLVRADAEPRAECILVLDDVHVLVAPAAQAALAFLVERLPAAFHLILAGRGVPALPLARLRMQGQLLELDAQHLRFTDNECRAFFRDTMGLSVTDTDASVLEARTEGWVAGLQLVALAIQQRPGQIDVIPAIHSDTEYLGDYLAADVLAHLPTHLRSFMLQTSILDRMCGPLCDAMLGFADGSSRNYLDELQRRNLFLVPLDGERSWYRYHQLFAETLRAELRADAPAAEIALLHQRAAHWFEQAGDLDAAISHLLTAGALEQAAALVELQAAGRIERGDLLPLMRWYDLLPAEVIDKRPILALAGAMLSIARGDLGTAEALVRAAPLVERREQERVPAWSSASWLSRLPETAALVRSSLARAHGDVTQALALARGALDERTEADAFLRQWRQWELGATQLLSGDLDAARAVLSELFETGDPAFSGLLVQAAASLASLAVRSGRLREAARIFLRGLERLKHTKRATGRGYGLLHAGLAALFLEWNDLAAAEQHVEAAIALGRQPPNALLLGVGNTLLARLHHARGDSAAADALAQASAVLPALQAPIFADMLLRHGYARACLALGDTLSIRLWATELPTADWPASDAWEIARLRLLLYQGQPAAVVPALTALIEQSLAGGWFGTAIEGWVLLARTHATLGALPEALVALQQALERSEAERYVRTFVDEGAAIAALLRILARSGSAELNTTSYIADLLAAFPAAQHAAEASRGPRHSAPSATERLAEPLTAREREVLRLMIAGHANAAIAAALTIEVGTVKRHVHSLLGKLGARNRVQAIARAHDLGLI